MPPLRHLPALDRRTLFSRCPQCARHMTTTAPLSSGHSRWSTIKHDKGKNDAVRSKQNNVIAKELADASRSNGSDPISNPRLADAVAKAKKAGYPKANIEAAIARGQGKSSNGQALESLTVEAVMPPVALIVEALTDSKGKALQELRNILKKAGAQATPTSYLFQQRGRIVFEPKDGIGVDEVLESALEVGAVDVTQDEEGRLVVDTEPTALKEAETVLARKFEFDVSSSDTEWVPNADTLVEELDREPLGQLVRLQDELQEYPGVQGIYLNADIDALQSNAAAQ